MSSYRKNNLLLGFKIFEFHFLHFSSYIITKTKEGEIKSLNSRLSDSSWSALDSASRKVVKEAVSVLEQKLDLF